jgi:membrane protein YdbS with pleckstrin-like domain
MKQHVEDASKWCYEGVWGILTRWFRVPQLPPSLPALEGETIETFRPADGFLRYLLFQFWIGLFVIDVLIFVCWLAITVAAPVAGLFLLLPALFVAVVPDIVAYVAVHLRYDTTWYALSDRSLRIRRGIWVIHETTITFENVQNVSVRQGPLQRWFGIANVLVETAGGGGHSNKGEGVSVFSHQGLVEGVADADRVRNLVLTRWRKSQAAGLGDEAAHIASVAKNNAWNPAHVAALAQIRDAVRQLNKSGK